MDKKKDFTKERRKFQRLAFEGNMQLYSGSEAWHCEIIDLSLKGILFSKPHDWVGKQNDTYRLVLLIQNAPSISMSIVISHVDKDSIGAKWNKIDVDSFSRLKRLLELNTIDRKRLLREISLL